MRHLIIGSILCAMAAAPARAEEAKSQAPAEAASPAPATGTSTSTSGTGDSGPSLEGPMYLVRPSAAQWIGLTRVLFKSARMMSGHLSNLAALRLELVDLMLGVKVEGKAVDEKSEQIRVELVKAAGDAVLAIFEFREVLTPEQRQVVTQRICMRILNRRLRRTERARNLTTRIEERAAAVHGQVTEIGMTLEQRAAMKRLMVRVAPPMVRAGGEAASDALQVVEELLADSPSRDKAKAAAEAAANKAADALKLCNAAALEARGLLSPFQIEGVVARAPLRLLLGGMSAMR